MHTHEYDGLTFVPSDSGAQVISYFTFNDDALKGEKVDHSPAGDMYYIVFFKEDESGELKYDEQFEAIFVDPTVYVSHTLKDSNLYGCIVRKTTKSFKWFSDYVAEVTDKLSVLAQKRLEMRNTNGKR